MLDGTELVLFDIYQVEFRLNSLLRLSNYFSAHHLDQTCEVFYVDYGNMEELPINLVHEILPDFTRLPARAIACTIAEVRITLSKSFSQSISSIFFSLDITTDWTRRLDETSDLRICITLWDE